MYLVQLASAAQHAAIAPAEGSHVLPAAAYVFRQLLQPVEQPVLGLQPT